LKRWHYIVKTRKYWMTRTVVKAQFNLPMRTAFVFCF